MTAEAKRSAHTWVGENAQRLSGWTETIWRLAEPAWREYRSAAFYVDLLRSYGFEVESATGGMPTAFRAVWSQGTDGPTLGGYGEYDAVPGNSQEPVPYRQTRSGAAPYAAGHTDPHSALGTGALGGILAAQAAMRAHALPGTLVFFGEPAEKVCGAKPVHAAKGYYDDLDAAVSFHPSYMPALSNTCIRDTHCGSFWSRVYTFESMDSAQWGSGQLHGAARSPGANDALCLMYTTTKYTKESLLPHTGHWTVNEAILVGGQSTADNTPPEVAQIQYAWRAPTLEMQQTVRRGLDRNAKAAAEASRCRVRARWITKTRPGLANHAMARLTYRNLEEAGPPELGAEATAFAQDIQRHLGLEAMAAPFAPEVTTLRPPEEAEAGLRADLPQWQRNYTSDDYTDYTWHTPTARLYVGRASLRAPEPGYAYPDWVWNALGGKTACIDPTVITAAKAIAGTFVDLLAEPRHLEAAKAEFETRTGGGIGGTSWLPPLLPASFQPPVDLRWPEYVTTPRGEGWWIPEEQAPGEVL